MMDGHIVYQGKAKESITYFAEQGHVCHRHANPADYFMKITSVNYPKEPEDE